MDETPPEYNLDEEDEEFRQTLATPSISELELERNLDLLEEAETTKGQLAPFCRDWNWGKGIIGEGHHHKKIHQYWVKVIAKNPLRLITVLLLFPDNTSGARDKFLEILLACVLPLRL